jgi:hypothetical protein
MVKSVALCLGVAVTVASVFAIAAPRQAVASPAPDHRSDTASSCRSKFIVDPGLGIRVTVPCGLARSRQLESNSNQITLVGHNGVARVAIDGLEMTPAGGARAAESRAAADVLTGWMPHAGWKLHSQRRSWDTVAGETVLVLHGVHGGQLLEPETMILLAYRSPAGSDWTADRAVIGIYLPGPRMSSDQRKTVNSIHFIRRSEFFACSQAPYLSAYPNPVGLHNIQSVVLSCAKPVNGYGGYFTFYIRRLSGRTGSEDQRSLGTHREGSYGVVMFTLSAVGRKPGGWIISVKDHSTGRIVAKRVIYVRQK